MTSLLENFLKPNNPILGVGERVSFLTFLTQQLVLALFFLYRYFGRRQRSDLFDLRVKNFYGKSFLHSTKAPWVTQTIFEKLWL